MTPNITSSMSSFPFCRVSVRQVANGEDDREPSMLSVLRMQLHGMMTPLCKDLGD